jgi:pyruvate/2-oxoglutarate dehydrogenase complex dihydrolipoamide acyltransferase (E2) component
VKVILKLNRTGMTMQMGTIGEWFKRPGEAFVQGEALYSIETEKVNQDVPAPASGTLLEILVKAGEDVDVGSPVCAVDLVA